ncbi:CHAT domain-containing protein [Terrimonas pollutisoli]|uniref:CHAT domain-containing protein n=1 Tax=Terrimonas pollutisoli TaxID=3034147 RepID=UPI0023EC2843|nr:CHAT domain-containing tetratricopeptide repeat protein [Terrimonas sp. H1YJ31]
MRRGLLILISSVLLLTASLSGQCPDKDFLFKRIRFVKDSSGFTPQEKIAELLGYLDKMDSCPYRNDSTHVFLLRKIVDIYFEQADFLKAAQYLRQVIDIISANAHKPSIKIEALPRNYYYLSVMYDSLNNIAGRMKALDSCFTIAMRINHVDNASLKALYTQVKYFYDVGDYHRCIDYAAKCRSLGQGYADNNTGLEKKIGESYAFSSLGWQVNALLKLKKNEQAEDLMKNKIEEYRKQGLKEYLGLAYGQLAEVQQQKGNFEMALFYYNQCLKCYQETGDRFNYKQTLKDIGYKIYFMHFKDGDKALAYYKKALKYVNKEENMKSYDVFESLNIFTQIANVYVQKGLYDSAFQCFRLAFDQIKSGSNEKDVLESSQAEFITHRKIHYLTGLFIDKGNAFLKQYENSRQRNALHEAIRIYKMADLLLDRVKLKQKELESKLFWRSDSRRLYENAIEACYLQGNTTDAFYFFEKSRAVLLNDQLNEQQWMGETDILKQTQLKKSILNLERGLVSEKSSGAKYAAFQSQIFSAKQELDRLEQSIKTKNPLYYQNFLDTGFISLSYTQKNLLNHNQALLEIFSGDSAVYVLLITARHSFLKRIDKQDYENTVSEYISYISNGSLLNRDFAGYIKVASHLYSLIFNDKLPPGQRIIISPDGQYFPFESLVSTNAVKSPGYLINDHAVSYTYSARFLMNDFKTSSGNGRNFMGVAPINYPVSFSLASLPGSDQSLQRIANYFGYSTKQVAINASRNNFLRQFSGYKIIQLYTHAADSSINNEPVIYFADSALYLSDLIHESKPVTRLIVLSACETGRGKLYNGEGVFSFNRGFAALGIPSAITNLWAVDNESTYELTELFYKWLAKDLPIDIALQKAKLEFLETASGERLLPFYWAAPVLVGKSDSIHLEKAQPWKWIVLLTGVGCIVFFAARKWAISKKAA